MKKILLAVAIGSAGLLSVQAETQTKVDAQGFVSPTWNAVGDPAWGGQNGWVAPGPGSADAVTAGYAGFQSSPTGQSGSLGAFPLLGPAQATYSVGDSFTPMSPLLFNNISATYVVEWSMIDFAGGAGTYNDLFSFGLLDGGSSVLSFNLTSPSVNPGFDYRLTSVGAATVNQVDLDFNAVYRMQIDIASNGSWSGTIWGVNNPSTTQDLVNATALTSGTLLGGALPSAIDEVSFALTPAILGTLGDSGLLINNVTLTNTGDPIPEPGTWAMAALLVSGAAATIYRRRKAAKEVAA